MPPKGAVGGKIFDVVVTDSKPTVNKPPNNHAPSPRRRQIPLVAGSSSTTNFHRQDNDL